jgi:mono/diheme cytochrome c family protein
MRAKALLATAIAAVVVLRAATGMAEEATDKGGRLYENYCSNCHGEELKNNTDGLRSTCDGSSPMSTLALSIRY